MAEIDKGLPNTRTKLEIPSEEEIAEEISVEEPEEQKGPVEVVPEEDGGATIDFGLGAINIPGTENHFDNLADILPEENLEPIGNEMVQNYMDYKASRKDWEQAYTTGLDLLDLNTKIELSHFKELVVQHIQFLQKQLHSFKLKLTKNYYLQMDQLEHKL